MKRNDGQEPEIFCRPVIEGIDDGNDKSHPKYSRSIDTHDMMHVPLGNDCAPFKFEKCSISRINFCSIKF